MQESPSPRSVCKFRIKQNLEALVQDLERLCLSVCVCVRERFSRSGEECLPCASEAPCKVFPHLRCNEQHFAFSCLFSCLLPALSSLICVQRLLSASQTLPHLALPPGQTSKAAAPHQAPSFELPLPHLERQAGLSFPRLGTWTGRTEGKEQKENQIARVLCLLNWASVSAT